MPLLRTTAGRLVVLAALLALVIAGNAVRGSRAPQGIEVDGLEVVTTDLTVDIRASGVTHAADPVEIRAPLSGRLVDVTVEPGDQAAVDHVIARYDTEDLRVQVGRLQQELAQARAQLADLLNRRSAAEEQAGPQLAQAESRVRQARLALQGVLQLPEWDLERKQAEERVREAEAALVELKSRLEGEQVSAEQIAAARASVTAAEAALAQAQARLVDVELRTPEAGTVLEVLVEPGESVTAGQLIARIARLDVVEIIAEIDETDVGSVKPGLTARVNSLAYPDRTFTAEVVRLSPVARRQGQVGVFDVTLRAENGEQLLRPGMTVSVDIESERRSGVLVVPNAALTVRDGRNGVFVIENGSARFQPLETGLSTATQVEVLDGLKAGDVIVAGPPAALRVLADGDAVRTGTPAAAEGSGS